MNKVLFGLVGVFLFTVMTGAYIDNSWGATLVERGAYLVKGIGACGNCHNARKGLHKGKALAGGRKFGRKKRGFVAYGSNLTSDKNTGLGNWSDAQFVRAMREGVRPDGSMIGQPMPIPVYHAVADADLTAIIAYLRSLPPVRNKVPKSWYKKGLPKSYGPPVGHVATAAKGDKVSRGEQLAALGHCMECHTPRVKGKRDFKNKMGAGGNRMRGVMTSNITPDKDTGIGTWTDQEIKNAITKGMGRGGTPLRGLMVGISKGYYKNINNSDLDAIVAYLRSLKPIRNKIR